MWVKTDDQSYSVQTLMKSAVLLQPSFLAFLGKTELFVIQTPAWAFFFLNWFGGVTQHARRPRPDMLQFTCFVFERSNFPFENISSMPLRFRLIRFFFIVPCAPIINCRRHLFIYLPLRRWQTVIHWNVPRITAADILTKIHLEGRLNLNVSLHCFSGSDW